MEQSGQNRKIVVGMSGGVDSSVALALLKKQGWRPIGVSLKYPVWESTKNLLKENVCCSAESFCIAADVCRKLDIPHFIADVSEKFQKEVVDYFTDEFKACRTPNPCVVCNRRLKFNELFAWARENGVDYVATGHYARLRREIPNSKFQIPKYQLLKAKDEKKDQTYSLCWLPQEWLGRIVFPLGDYLKEDIYKMAEKNGFEIFRKKKESQDFCFVAGKSLPCFLEEKLGRHPGEIVDSGGRVLGKHAGLHFYTIGQRKGINLSDGPYFVKEFDAANNRLIVTKSQEEISKEEIFLSLVNFISGEAPTEPLEVEARVRYGQPLSAANIMLVDGGRCRIVFQNPQSAATPGQFCVFYHSDICLGGGIID